MDTMILTWRCVGQPCD